MSFEGGKQHIIFVPDGSIGNERINISFTILKKIQEGLGKKIRQFLLPAVVDCGDNVAFESDFFIAD